MVKARRALQHRLQIDNSGNPDSAFAGTIGEIWTDLQHFVMGIAIPAF